MTRNDMTGVGWTWLRSGSMRAYPVRDAGWGWAARWRRRPWPSRATSACPGPRRWRSEPPPAAKTSPSPISPPPASGLALAPATSRLRTTEAWDAAMFTVKLGRTPPASSNRSCPGIPAGCGRRRRYGVAVPLGVMRSYGGPRTPDREPGDLRSTDRAQAGTGSGTPCRTARLAKVWSRSCRRTSSTPASRRIKPPGARGQKVRRPRHRAISPGVARASRRRHPGG